MISSVMFMTSSIRGVKANRNTPRDKWIEFIETNEILDSLEESVSMMEIGED